MRVCIVSSEVFPFSKTGGLADVAGALPVALAKKGIETVVFSPAYRSAKKYPLTLKAPEKEIKIGSRKDRYALLHTEKEGVHFYFIENDHYYDRDSLYVSGGVDYKDNAERFSLLCAATLDALKEMELQVDIIHLNDWQTSLIPLYKKLYFSSLSETKTLLTIHNIAYQGIFPHEKLETLGIPSEYFNPEMFEFYGNINLLKGGIVLSDFINTVSKTYAEEIQTEEYGCGLEGVLKKFKDKLTGIVNGIDTNYWNPETDKMIFANYSASSLQNKKENKKRLKELLHLTEEGLPLFGMVSRIDHQKGFDILIPAVERFLKKRRAHFVFLGSGDKNLEKLLIETEKKHGQLVSVNIMFNEELAHRIYASSDFFMMPSRFEPCGLSQLISYRYGAIPIVRATGGLKDTVKSLNRSPSGTGFIFKTYKPEALLNQMFSAVKLHEKETERMRGTQRRIMLLDYSWDNRAAEYMKLYRKIIFSA